MTNSRPLLLDASVLVAYERELTRRAQAFVVEAIPMAGSWWLQHCLSRSPLPNWQFSLAS